MGKPPTIAVVLLIALLAVSQLVDAKRTLSSGRRSGSSGSSSRRTHTSNSGHVTKPTYQQSSNSHADLAKLSYSGYNQQPNRPAQAPAAAQPANTRPIGWNVPAKQEAPAVAVNKPPVQAGPPPAYSPHNVPGARTNVNEAPPPYSAMAGAGAMGAVGGAGAAHVAHQQPVYHQPSYSQPQSHGMYPQQTYHPSGGYPGAPPSYPGGAPVMYPAGSAPHMYPVGGAPPAASFPVHSQPVYQGSAIQPGFYPAGSLPVGAVQQSSSGPGFGSGLLAGAVGGAILGHVLTPSGGSSNNGGSEHDKVVIINNPPASGAPAAPAAPAAAAPAAPVAAPDAGAASAGAAPMVPPVVPAAGVPAAVAPAVVPPVFPGSTAAVAPIASVPDTAGNETSTPTPLAPLSGETNTPPPVYGLMCVPVMVNVSDPANPSNITAVEQIACYNVSQPAAPAPPPPMPEAPVQLDRAMESQQQAIPAPPPTQKTSDATIAESAQLNKNAAFGKTATSGFTLLSTIVALLVSYSLH